MNCGKGRGSSMNEKDAKRINREVVEEVKRLTRKPLRIGKAPPIPMTYFNNIDFEGRRKALVLKQNSKSKGKVYVPDEVFEEIRRIISSNETAATKKSSFDLDQASHQSASQCVTESPNPSSPSTVSPNPSSPPTVGQSSLPCFNENSSSVVTQSPAPFLKLNRSASTTSTDNQSEGGANSLLETYCCPTLPIRTRSPRNEDNENLTVSYFKEAGVGVTLKSIRRLAPNAELDDDLLDVGIYHLIQGMKEVAYIRASTWKLTIHKNKIPPRQVSNLFKMTTKWGEAPNLLLKRFIVIPVNMLNHWFLCIICSPFPNEESVQIAYSMIASGRNKHQVSESLYNQWINGGSSRPMVFVLDSIYKGSLKTYPKYSFCHREIAKYSIAALRHIHQSFWTATKSSIQVHNASFEMIGHHSLLVPEQTSGKDCGVYCILFARHWFQTMITTGSNYMAMVGQDCSYWFQQADMVLYRRTLNTIIAQQCKSQYPSHCQKLLAASPHDISGYINQA